MQSKKKVKKEGIKDYFQDTIAWSICGDMICRARIKSHNTNSICKKMKTIIDSKTIASIKYRNTDGRFRIVHYDMFNN